MVRSNSSRVCVHISLRIAYCTRPPFNVPFCYSSSFTVRQITPPFRYGHRLALVPRTHSTAHRMLGPNANFMSTFKRTDLHRPFAELKNLFLRFVSKSLSFAPSLKSVSLIRISSYRFFRFIPTFAVTYSLYAPLFRQVCRSHLLFNQENRLFIRLTMHFNENGRTPPVRQAHRHRMPVSTQCPQP